MALGAAFHSFMPLGHRANLEHDLVFMLEAYQHPVDATMSMPSSRRHRIVKIRQEIVRSKGKGGRGGETYGGPPPTGLTERGQQWTPPSRPPGDPFKTG